MALTTILYLALFFGSIFGSIFYHPMVGLLAYLATYNINPIEQWWRTGLPIWIMRYALILGVATLLGGIIHHNKLKFKSLIEAQEILLLAYVAVIGTSVFLGLYNPKPEYNFIKMAKVAMMLMMASHLVTTLKRYELMLLFLILLGLYLGVKIYNAPAYFFTQGRFQSGIGGSDFSDGNVLSGHFVMLLPLLGIMLMKGKWLMKGFCTLSAAFMVNGIILIKSRASFLALVICVPFAMLLSTKVGRKKILPYLLLGLIGGAVLLDPGYLLRMKTINTETQEMDRAEVSRIDFWKVAIRMAFDYPLGIGEGNFTNYIGNYAPEWAGRDTHNTYLRCLAELGFPGLLVLLLLIVNAFRMLSRISAKAESLENKQSYFWHIYGLRLALIGYLIVVNFISTTYVEDMFWLLMFPMFLKRCIDNEESEAKLEVEA